MQNKLLRLTAFADTPNGGNPAGVWIGVDLPEPEEMQRIAAEVGFSETAFLARGTGNTWTTRYFSPEAEVPFCGHATIASAVALGASYGAGEFTMVTQVGPVPVEVTADDGGRMVATLTSVAPKQKPVPAGVLDDALATLGWSTDDLDASIPPVLAFAGAWHLVIAVEARSTLARLDYAFDDLKTLMAANDLTTLQLVWREDEATFHARNPFPPGGVVEDPATGAAAAALGGYLRSLGLVTAPAQITILQGYDMGRPSVLTVGIPAEGGIRVTGSAVPI